MEMTAPIVGEGPCVEPIAIGVWDRLESLSHTYPGRFLRS